MAAPGRSRRTHFDVIIVGMGPVGAVCANLMGKYGVQTLVFEKEVEVYNGPRAVAIDAETTRIFGMIDLDEWLDRHVLKAGYQVLSASEGERWPIVDLQTTGQAYGYSKISYFYQPTVEAELRRNLKKFPKVTVFLGYEVTDVAEGPDDLVYVQVKYIGGLSGEVYTCKYLLACDGGRSTVRRQMKLRYEGKADTERWLVLDLHSKNKDINHCWSKFTYVIAGKRPYLHVPLPESYHRFELLLDDHEDAEEMTKLDNVKRMLNSVGLDSSQVSLHRRIVYKFHSRMVEQWNIGHAFLLGDAAHSLPPFRGQGSTGMCSGIRDASNLCWKLSLNLQGLTIPPSISPNKEESTDESLPSSTTDRLQLPQVGFDQLAVSYQLERRPHVSLMTRHAKMYGTLTKLRNPVATFFRDMIFYLMVQLPFVKHYVSEDGGKPLPTVISGFIDNQSIGAGKLFPQPYVSTGLERLLLDKVLGSSFVLIGMGQNPKKNLTTDAQLKLSGISCKFLTVNPSTMSDRPPEDYFTGSTMITDVDEAIQPWFKQHEASLVLLRPDRFVFGHADNSPNSGNDLIGRFHSMLMGKQPLTVRTSASILITFWDKCSMFTAFIFLMVTVCIIGLLYALLF